MKKLKTIHGTYTYVDVQEVAYLAQQNGAVYGREEPHTEVVMKNGGVVEIPGLAEEVAAQLGIEEE